jgi:hypothetical protein
MPKSPRMPSWHFSRKSHAGIKSRANFTFAVCFLFKRKFLETVLGMKHAPIMEKQEPINFMFNSLILEHLDEKAVSTLFYTRLFH